MPARVSIHSVRHKAVHSDVSDVGDGPQEICHAVPTLPCLYLSESWQNAALLSSVEEFEDERSEW